MFGTLVIAYLFLGGASSGLLCVTAARGIAFRRLDHDVRIVRSFGRLTRRCYAIGLALLCLAVACLFWDLGQPERILLVLSRPHATVLTVGMVVIVAEVVVGALLASASFFSLPWSHGLARRALEALCIVASIAMMAYTAVFLIDLGMPLWNTWTLVGLFLASSLSSGISIMLLVNYLALGSTLLLFTVRPLQKLHVACLVVEAAFLAAFAAAAFANPAAGASIGLLLEPRMLATATVGVIGFGIVAPFALETYSLSRTTHRTIPVSDVLCLCGGLLLRYCIISCGAY